MKVSDLFNVIYGHSLYLNRLQESSSPEAINFVSRTGKTNGVSSRVVPVEGLEAAPAGAITVALGGSVLATFVQTEPFYCGKDIKYLLPKSEMMDIRERLWWAMCIAANRYRYNYGRQANRTLAGLNLPEKMPDWARNVSIPNLLQELLESAGNFTLALDEHLTDGAQHSLPQTIFIPDLEHARKSAHSVQALPALEPGISLADREWIPFRLTDIFTITGTKTTPIAELEEHGPGEHPYVTTQATNNGVEGFHNHYTENGGVLTVDSAVLGYCAYQSDDFSASDHVEKLEPRDIPFDQFIALFLVTMINAEQYRYNYGRKCSQARMKRSVIWLPVTSNDEPDWQWMRDYVCTLPYSSSLDDQTPPLASTASLDLAASTK